MWERSLCEPPVVRERVRGMERVGCKRDGKG